MMFLVTLTVADLQSTKAIITDSKRATISEPPRHSQIDRALVKLGDERTDEHER